MSRVYLYALLGERPPAPLGEGLAGEPLRLVAAGDVLAVVGDVPDGPAVDQDAMRAHDAVVRRVAALVDAILPARFGGTSDEAALADAVASRAPALRRTLALVSGREQMTLRVYGTAAPPSPAPGDVTGGPGTQYLARRRERALAARRLPEIDPVSESVASLVHATRVRRHATPPLLGSVYHLVERAQGEAYLARVDAARSALRDDVEVVASGPWPPYAFASDEDP